MVSFALGRELGAMAGARVARLLALGARLGALVVFSAVHGMRATVGRWSSRATGNSPAPAARGFALVLSALFQCRAHRAPGPTGPFFLSGRLEMPSDGNCANSGDCEQAKRRSARHLSFPPNRRRAKRVDITTANERAKVLGTRAVYLRS